MQGHLAGRARRGLDRGEQHLERVLGVLELELDPAELVQRVRVGPGLREAEHGLVASLGVGELVVVEEVLGEREVRLGHVDAVRKVLQQLVVDRPRFVHVLGRLQRVGVREQRLVEPAVVAKRAVVGEPLERLHRLEQVGLGPLRCAASLLHEARAPARVGARGDARVELRDALEREVLLCRVDLPEPEVVVGLLLDLGVGRLGDQLDQDLLLLRPGIPHDRRARQHVLETERRAAGPRVGRLREQRAHPLGQRRRGRDRLWAGVAGSLCRRDSGQRDDPAEHQAPGHVASNAPGHRTIYRPLADTGGRAGDTV